MIVVPYRDMHYYETCLNNEGPRYCCARRKGHSGRHYDGIWDEVGKTLEVKAVW